MLDYAANAVVYWPVEAVRSRFEEGSRKQGLDPEKLVETLAGPGSGVEEFWQRVKTNLQAGRVRMVFVADVIPSELRRVVEFFNGQMDPAEVLAVEIKQFVGQGLKTLVPRVIGQTVEAERKKGSPGSSDRQWNEVSFFETLRQRSGVEDLDIVRAVMDWAKRNQLRIWWGYGNKEGSFFPMFDHNNESYCTVSVWTNGRVGIPFQWMTSKNQPDSESRRNDLRDLLNRIPGVVIPADAVYGRPLIPQDVLADPARRLMLLDALERYLASIKNS
jgi:hypothetical protein